MFSQYIFRKFRIDAYGDQTISLRDAINIDPTLVTNNCFATSIKKCYELFDQDYLFVGFYDDLQNDPELFTAALYNFIGLDDDFIPEVLFQSVNASAKARFPALAAPIQATARLMRRYHFYKLLSQRVHNLLLRAVDRKSIQSETIDKALYSELKKHSCLLSNKLKI